MSISISNGQSSSGIVFGAAVEFLRVNGVAINTTVSAGGSMLVSSGGIASKTTINSRGILIVSSGGMANSTTINSYGSMFVSNSGTGSNTLVNNQGRFYVFNGGLAGRTTVNSGGYMRLDGGTADSTTIKSGGSILISSGGTATNILASSGAYLGITVVSNTHIQGRYADSAFEMKDALILGYTIQSGFISISAGGTANSTTINSGGSMFVSSDGTANNTIVNNGGTLYVSSGGMATDIIWTPCEGHVYVLDGAQATFASKYSGVYYGSANKLLSNTASMNSVTIDSVYEICVMLDGTANNTTVNTLGKIHVSSGGMANSTTINSSGSLFVSNGGTGSNTIVNNQGEFYVFNGGQASHTTVNSGGHMHLSGGTANSTTINADGCLFISNGGIANSISINSGAYLDIFSGGTASNVVWTPCEGHIYVSEGGFVSFLSHYSGVYWGMNNQLLSHAATMDSIVLDYPCEMYVMSDGTAHNTTINSGGFMSISSNGEVIGITVNQHGNIEVSSGGIANNATVNANGEMVISEGGIASNVTVNPYGLVHIKKGGTAVIVENGGCVDIASGANVSFESNTFSGLALAGYVSATVHSGTTANNTVLSGVHSLLNVLGGVANNTTLTYYSAGMCVDSGGTAYKTSIGGENGCNMVVLNGGLAESTFLLRYGANVYVSSGGTANIITTSNGGTITVSSGGEANNVYLGYQAGLRILGGIANYITVHGGVHICSGGEARNITNYGTATVSSGTANYTTINSNARLIVSSGGTANNTTINSGGSVIVSEGGILYNAQINGGRLENSGGTVSNIMMQSGIVIASLDGKVNNASVNTNCSFYVGNGGIANRIMLNGGTLFVSSGGLLTGRMICLDGMISAFYGACIDFDLTTTNPGNTARISNLNCIQGLPTYTITIKSDQTEGVYVLADEAEAFNQNITVVNASGENLGVLSVGETISISGVAYTLNLSGKTLSLKIGEYNPLSPYTSDGLIISNGIQNVEYGESFYDTLVLSSGEYVISSGGTATDTTIYDKGRMIVSSGGTATDINMFAGAYLDFSVAQNTYITGVSDGASFSIKDGNVSNYAINSGYLRIFSGCVAENTTVNANACLTISSGGMATGIMENGGYVEIQDGATASFAENSFYGAVLANSSATIHSGTTANELTLNSNGQLFVYSGIVNTAAVNSGGSIWVGGGTLNGITINRGGSVMISSEGMVNSTTVNSSGTLSISNGIAHYTTVYNTGAFYVSDGGIANSTTIYGGGNLFVSSGGTADDTVVSSGGSFYVSSGGVVNSTTINSSCLFYVSSGVVANSTTVNVGQLYVYNGGYASNMILIGQSGRNAGDLYIQNGGIIEDVTIKNYGDCYVSSGGVVKNITVNSGGSFVINNGASATGIIENGGCVEVTNGAEVAFASNSFSGLVFNSRATIHSGTTANNTTLNANAQLIVYSGGIADSTTINSSGQMQVYADGSANNVTVNTNATLFISSGGKATGIIENGGFVSVADGTDVSFATNTFSGLELSNVSATVHANTTANSVTLNANGQLFVYAGGTASNATINANGYLRVSSGGKADKANIASGGNLVISSGGIADGAIVNANAWLTVSSGGTATNVIWTPCAGRVVVEDGAYVTYASQFAGVYYGSGNNLLSSAIVMNSVTLEASYEMHVMSNGTADSTIVNNAGNLYVTSGGNVNNTAVNTGGNVLVSGGAASNTTINNGGSFQVSSGGKANSAIVAAGGYFYVDVGGSAMDIVASSGAYLGFNVASGTYIAGTSDGFTFEIKDGNVSDFTINSGYLSIAEDGIASNTTVNNRGRLTVSSGGTATGIVENGGWVDIQNGANVTFAANTISGLVLSNTSATVHSGTTATRALVERGRLVVYSGGMARRATVNSGGSLLISSGGVVGSTTLNGSVFVSSRYNEYQYRFSSGCMNVYSGGIADHTKVNAGGFMWISQGGLASNTSICGLGFLNVSSSGMVDNTTVGASGTLWISRGGIAKNTTINAGGSMYVSEGRITGQLIISDGAIVSVDSRTVIDFDISDRTPGSPALINNLFLLIGSPTYTLTVSDIQVGGIYSLADEVNVFNNNITVQNTHGKTLGKIALNKSLTIGETTYSLSLEDSLILTVEAPDRIVPTVSNIQASITTLTNQNVILTADFADDVELASALYKIGENGEWTTYVDSVSVSENTIVYFKAIDTAGNESEVVSYTVSNIDKIAPKKPVPTANITTPTNMDVLVTADFDDDSVSCEYSLNGKNWGIYPGGILFGANMSVYFRSVDAAGNVSEVAEYEVTNIDRTAPSKPVVSADVTTPTNRGVMVSATFDEDTSTKEYSLDGEEWLAYTDTILCAKNETVSFRGIDAAGNVSEVVSLEVNNIDTEAPSDPAGLKAYVVDHSVVLVWNVSTDNSGVKEYVVKYTLEGQTFTATTSGTSYVLNNAASGTYNWSVQAADFAGNESAIVAGDAFTVSDFKPYTVEYSADNFEHTIRFTVSSPTLNSFRMPSGTYQIRVRQEGSNEWMTGDSIVAAELDATPQLIKSDADGNADVFFANPIGTWESGYVAQHVGSIGDWTGTNEYTTLFGKNKLADIIEGSTDANILLMTDDDNGDTLFVDDIYTASPGGIAEKQSRIAQIDEIRAGAGNDIVDMTSQNFEYIGDGLTIRGGEGNDTIWANKGDNWLFGDAGNDRIVGASGNDVIAGGIGNDRMHGGGGKDMFTFCENWGVDNVEQLAGSEVVLWFAEGSQDNWDASKLTYTDGTNSVRVSGVTADLVTLKFGDDGSDEYRALASAGAFFDATTERIFEEEGKGMLASL